VRFGLLLLISSEFRRGRGSYTCRRLLVYVTGAYLLLFSSGFSAEFRKLKESRPKYRVILARILLTAIISAAAVATLVDVQCLATDCPIGASFSEKLSRAFRGWLS
jgi:hypothetical protein